MRIAFLSYPMLFQRQGGLQVQLLQTLAALREIGIEASLFDTNTGKLTGFDIAHVFAAINGNHRIVEAAKTAGIPVVLSSILNPPWTGWDRRKAEFCDRLTGRLTHWQVQTTYRQIEAALKGADRIVALGETEKTLISTGYIIPESKIEVVPNGVASIFFDADGDAFRESSGVSGKFALITGSISPYKNQLGVIDALRGEDIGVVLIGQCLDENKAYLDRCLKTGDGRVHYAGSMEPDDRLFASAYAAANVFVLASKGEVMPLVVLEALAAGTPVVLTKHHSMDLRPDGETIVEVDPSDNAAIRDAAMTLARSGIEASKCRALVRDYTWDSVAMKLRDIYEVLHNN